MKVGATLIHDLKFQLRHGFYWVYLFLVIFYITILYYLPSSVVKEGAVDFILFSDTAVLGFFFIGGLILLEKSQNILESLFVTPLRLSEYLLSKFISLTLLALLASLVVVYVAFSSLRHPLLFTVGVTLSSFFFIGMGVALVSQAKTINDYFFKGTLYTLLLFIPLLHRYGLIDSPLRYFFPTHASLLLFRTAYTELSTQEMWYSLMMLIVASTVMDVVAYRLFRKYIILKIGAEK